jgi:dihydroorotase
MTLFFRDDYTAAELEAARPHLFAIKLYPHGVTTNSESGIHSIHAGTPVFRLMEEMGIPLLVHGETSGFVMDREREFLPVYEWLATTFPRLRIVMEHITTEAAVQLLDRYENLHATVTPHHLVITLDDVAGGLLQPHLFCKPIAKRPEDRDALLAAALAAHPKLMMGSDSRASRNCSLPTARSPISRPSYRIMRGAFTASRSPSGASCWSHARGRCHRSLLHQAGILSSSHGKPGGNSHGR